MSIDDAISIISACRRYTTQSNYKAAYDVALEALREKQEAEKNEPLTLVEIREIKGEKPLWLIDLQRPEFSCWTVLDGGYAYIPGVEYGEYSIKKYGEQWIACLHEPKEATSHDD